MRMVRAGGALCVLLCLGGAAAGQAPKASKAKGVALTIYNQNFALVKEKRSIDLATGRNSLLIEDVAALIDPTSVSIKSLTAPGAVAVREQNYQYDLMSPTTLLNKSVGKPITITQIFDNGRTRDIKGTIMAPFSVSVAQTGERQGGSETNFSGLIVKANDGGIVLNPMGQITLHEMPAGLIVRPQLSWLLDSTKAGPHEVEVAYMTDGVTWKADYVAIVNSDDRSVDVTGWVTLDNQSGATYENASLQLIAGDVRRLRPATTRGSYGGGAADSVAPAPQFREESFFEYHLYTLDGTTTVRDKEQKQMTLLAAEKAPAEKKFVYDGRRGIWGVWLNGDHPGESYDKSAQTKFNVVMEIQNSKPALGIALPKGRVRLYKADSRGALQFLGEDAIDHTPKDETLRLYVGESFDAVGERKRTNFRRISDREVEESFEIGLRNHRTEDMRVSVIEHLSSDWEILEKSQNYVKKDAHTVEFVVPLKKDGEAKVTYTVRTRW